MRRPSRILALLLLLATVLQPVPALAQSGGNCSVFRTWNTGDSLTAGDLNSSFSTVGVTNVTQACIDGISDSAANMQAVTAPWASATESLATSGAGELQRLRYVIADFLGLQYWYRTDRNVDFASTHSGGTIQGNGVGRHVTAVALHTWAGSNLWPAITSVRAHQTGLMWGTPGAIFVGAPTANGTGVANHMTVMVDATDDQGRFGIGQTNARTWYSFHAAALTLHHTAALRFAHSQSMMGDGQYGHVTALRISRARGDGSLNNAGFQEGNDQLILGHVGATLAIESARVTVTAQGNLTLSGTGPHAIGGATDAGSQLYLLGAKPAGSGAEIALRVSTGLSPAANQDTYGIYLNPTITEAAAGVHPLLTALYVTPAITNGAATATDAVGVYVPTFVAGAGTTNASGIKINAAPTGATNNYALWIAAGNQRVATTTYMGPNVTTGSEAGPFLLFNAATFDFAGGTTSFRWINQANSAVRMTLTDGGILGLGTTVTTSAGAGDFVQPNGAGGEHRFVNAAGTDTVIGLSLNAANNLRMDFATQTTIGANGAASALTANPVGYIVIDIAGTERIIPFYTK